MPLKDFHILPKLRDSLSYLYIEHAIVDRSQSAIEFINQEGRVMVPVAALCVLMLGPGTSITHAAIKVLSENGCTVLWVGEDFTRFYSQGLGETRKSFHLLRQAVLVCDPQKHSRVVLAMYRKRFKQPQDPSITLPQLRGLEGARVKQAYIDASAEFHVTWIRRNYDMTSWSSGDPINRALSSANALLNGICHAAIVSGGYSPALGFIHTGRQLSFVYDIADLYKVELSIPAAFQVVSESQISVESRVRTLCRERFRESRLLERILPDIDELLEIHDDMDLAQDDPYPDLDALRWEELREESD
jgi:CRISPR-associated protein Cas1